MGVEFEDKNHPIVLKPTGDMTKKISFVQNLYDKAQEKINHFDRLRQQHLNYALLAFSGLVGFVINVSDNRMQIIGCLGIILLMFIFSVQDNRMHKFTHGFTSSILIFTQVMAYLLENPQEEISFLQYHAPGERNAKWWKNLKVGIYGLLAIAAFILGLLTYVTSK
ncbi:MAG: hypothetical protein PVJ60_10310 [Phycisphaerales bacterium]|jgi:hypothetical protein